MADGVAPGDVYRVLGHRGRRGPRLPPARGHPAATSPGGSAASQPPQWLASGEVVMTNGRIGRGEYE